MRMAESSELRIKSPHMDLCNKQSENSLVGEMNRICIGIPTNVAKGHLNYSFRRTSATNKSVCRICCIARRR